MTFLLLESVVMSLPKTAIILSVTLTVLLPWPTAACDQGGGSPGGGSPGGPPAPPTTGLVPFYRYFRNFLGRDHFYTTNQGEIGTITPGQQGRHFYKSEGVQCRIYHKKVPGSVALYRYFRALPLDHFYTTNGNGVGGYSSEGIAGYCFPSQQPGTIPLYRYYSDRLFFNDHFYTTSPQEIGTTTVGATGKDGYRSEGITCYVFPA